ncbi:MAG: interleukin-like EMT inducer domain-containing protein [bacterium]
MLIITLAIIVSSLSIRQYSASKYLYRGKKYKESGLLYLSMRELEKALKQNPYDFEVKAQLGVVYGMLGEKAWHRKEIQTYNLYYKKCIDILEYLSQHMLDTEAQYNLAVSYELLGDEEKANQGYKYVIQLNPEHDKAKQRLSNMLVQQGIELKKRLIINQARDKFVEAISINESNIDAHVRIANIYYRENKIKEVLKEYKKIIQLGGNDDFRSKRLDFTLDNLTLRMRLAGMDIEESLGLGVDLVKRRYWSEAKKVFVEIGEGRGLFKTIIERVEGNRENLIYLSNLLPANLLNYIKELRVDEIKELLITMGLDISFPSQPIGSTQVFSPVDIVARSGGLMSENGAEILINGKKFFLNKRGYNIVVINKTSGEIKGIRAFDTHKFPTEVEALVNYVEDIPEGSIVGVVVNDDASKCLNKKSARVFEKIGADKDIYDKYRWSQAIIGVKGAERGTVLEETGKKSIELYVWKEDKLSSPLSPNNLRTKSQEQAIENEKRDKIFFVRYNQVEKVIYLDYLL